MTREDLRQEALIGLLEACRDFDSGRGHAFDKFASTCVYYAVHRRVGARCDASTGCSAGGAGRAGRRLDRI
ncbi:sigma factor [Solirubrobacter ginsenosidimutans]|uniref:sigma factor n=1 Tax=Solirubrobacter ginsenosidimutans TaxID=490573 RepID=UPI00355630B0